MEIDIKTYSEKLAGLLGDPYISLDLLSFKKDTQTYSLKVNGHTGIGVQYQCVFYILLYNGSLYKIKLPKEEPVISTDVLSDAKEKIGSRWNIDTIVVYNTETKETREITLPKPFKEYNRGIRAMKLKSICKEPNVQVLNREAIMEF